MGQRLLGLQLALLLTLSLIVLLHTTSLRIPSCLVRKCASETPEEGLRHSPEKEDSNCITVVRDGRLADGWFADVQDLRGIAGQPAEPGGWTERKGLGIWSTETVPVFRLSEGARLWLKSSVAFATPLAIRIETLGNQAGSLELTLLTLDGGHEHSACSNASSGAQEPRTVDFIADLSGVQFLLWQSIEVGSTGTGPLHLKCVQIDYPSPSELLQVQVDSMKAAVPALLSNRRTARTGRPSVLVSLLTLANDAHFQKRLVPSISVLASEVDLLLFVGNSTGEAHAEALAQKYGGLPLRWRNVSDAYPPRMKEFDSWQYVYENHVDNYEWFLHMDDDTFLHVDNLKTFLESVSAKVSNVSEPLYIGSPGFGATTHFNGRPLDLPVGSDGQILPFCMGGPGYLLNRPALLRLGPHFDTCLREWSSELSDTEFGRCVYKHLGIYCALGKSTTQQLRNQFRHLYDKPFTRALNLEHFKLLSQAVTLHSIKLDDDTAMANHMEVVKRLSESAL